MYFTDIIIKMKKNVDVYCFYGATRTGIHGSVAILTYQSTGFDV